MTYRGSGESGQLWDEETDRDGKHAIEDNMRNLPQVGGLGLDTPNETRMDLIALSLERSGDCVVMKD